MSRPFTDAEKLHIIRSYYSQGKETGKSHGQIAKELNEMPENVGDPRTARGVQAFLIEYRDLVNQTSRPVTRI